MSNALAGYGRDQYIRDYENELGAPWQIGNVTRISYPFYTPTGLKRRLFPLRPERLQRAITQYGAMYQCLRSLAADGAGDLPRPIPSAKETELHH